MAKILSITDISGQYGGQNVQKKGNSYYIRTATIPRNPKTTQQMNPRIVLEQNIQHWKNLSHVQKTAWKDYASTVGEGRAGYTQFLKNNNHLENAQNTSLNWIANPPGAYNPPDTPQDIGTNYNNGTDQWEITWTTPNTATDYVTAFGAVIANYADPEGKFFAIIETVQSNNQQINIDASDYATNSVLQVKLRSINEDGEISIFTLMKRITKT